MTIHSPGRLAATAALTPLLAAAALTAATSPAQAVTPDLAVQNDCGPQAQDLGKTFHLDGPLPVDHTGCATTDGQSLRVGKPQAAPQAPGT